MVSSNIVKEPLVMTTGTFNIVHAGHIELFEFCKNIGKTLIVGINTDRYLVKKYGNKTVPLEKRLKVLSSIKHIDLIYTFREDTPSNLIEIIKPNIYVKGPDYLGKELPEENILNKHNIKLIIPEVDKIMSTSNIIF
jgi:rfaE bifunctional protein nucleotidyltransferase chain/domain